MQDSEVSKRFRLFPRGSPAKKSETARRSLDARMLGAAWRDLTATAPSGRSIPTIVVADRSLGQRDGSHRGTSKLREWPPHQSCGSKSQHLVAFRMSPSELRAAYEARARPSTPASAPSGVGAPPRGRSGHVSVGVEECADERRTGGRVTVATAPMRAPRTAGRCTPPPWPSPSPLGRQCLVSPQPRRGQAQARRASPVGGSTLDGSHPGKEHGGEASCLFGARVREMHLGRSVSPERRNQRRRTEAH